MGFLVYLASVIAGVAAGRNPDSTDVVFLGLIGYVKQSVSAEVAKLAAEGKKIQAIKLLREQEGLGLAEAKRAVDHL